MWMRCSKVILIKILYWTERRRCANVAETSAERKRASSIMYIFMDTNMIWVSSSSFCSSCIIVENHSFFCTCEFHALLQSVWWHAKTMANNREWVHILFLPTQTHKNVDGISVFYAYSKKNRIWLVSVLWKIHQSKAMKWEHYMWSLSSLV